ncbi:MAG: two pore domain potassium channel family protein [Bacteroidales bacterium]|nr:two pore domain potassium channel family protein [Bacteroidales bacterium]
MLTNYNSFKVEIKDIPFTTPRGINTEKTALVSFFNKSGEVIKFLELGFIETRNIYDKIEKGENINLDDCYVKNFSLTAYRLYTLQEKKQSVPINGFTASDAIFDSNYVIDFSFAKFSNDLTSFRNTLFVNGDVIFESVEFGDGGVNFSNSFFRNGDLNFSKTLFGDGDVTFKDAILSDGKKDFQYAVFGKGELSFINTNFNHGDTSFINVNFGDGGVTYRVARFGNGAVDFRFAKFGKGELSFDRTEFGNGLVDFRTVEIKTDKVNFNRAIFGNGDVTFEAIEVTKARVNFKRAEFASGNISFELAECAESTFVFDRTSFGEGSISFLNSKFKSVSFVSCHFDHYLDLRMAKCDYVDLSDTIVRDIIDLKPFDFPIDIKCMNFSGMRLLGHLYIDWKRNNVKQLVLNQKEQDYDNIAEQFRILKENFSGTGQYIDEDKAYVEFKRNEAKAYLRRNIRKGKMNKLWAYPSYLFGKLIFDKMGLYATDPFRVIFSVIVVYTIFSLIYGLAPLFTNAEVITSLPPEQTLGIILRGFYISAITFFTIGYGDYLPLGFLRAVAGIEGFCGVFMMSYFTVAFVRKILR